MNGRLRAVMTVVVLIGIILLGQLFTFLKGHTAADVRRSEQWDKLHCEDRNGQQLATDTRRYCK